LKCQSFFECQNLNFYACLTDCVDVFRETGSVTQKKVVVGQSFVPKK
jgi:hypothetical protein